MNKDLLLDKSISPDLLLNHRKEVIQSIEDVLSDALCIRSAMDAMRGVIPRDHYGVSQNDFREVFYSLCEIEKAMLSLIEIEDPEE